MRADYITWQVKSLSIFPYGKKHLIPFTVQFLEDTYRDKACSIYILHLAISFAQLY